MPHTDKDPRAGDVVPIDPKWVRTVTKREKGWVYFDVLMDGRPYLDCRVRLSGWRRGLEVAK
jgi:hypothetical protein